MFALSSRNINRVLYERKIKINIAIVMRNVKKMPIEALNPQFNSSDPLSQSSTVSQNFVMGRQSFWPLSFGFPPSVQALLKGLAKEGYSQ
jgi:hypothetical protein